MQPPNYPLFPPFFIRRKTAFSDKVSVSSFGIVFGPNRQNAEKFYLQRKKRPKSLFIFNRFTKFYFFASFFTSYPA